MEFLAQLEPSLRGSRHFRRRNQARIHLTLLNTEGLQAAILPPPLDRQATRPPVFNCLAMPSSGES
jgi:hypothetical protein